MAIIDDGTAYSRNTNCCQKIKILIASNHKDVEFLQTALKRKEEFNIVDIAKNSKDLLQKAILLQPDLVIADLKINKIDKAVNTILNFKSFKCKVIVLSKQKNKSLQKLLYKGVHSYILRNNSTSEIINTVSWVTRKSIQNSSELLEETLIPEIEILEAKRETKSSLDKKTNTNKNAFLDNLKKILPINFVS